MAVPSSFITFNVPPENTQTSYVAASSNGDVRPAAIVSYPFQPFFPFSLTSPAPALTDRTVGGDGSKSQPPPLTRVIVPAPDGPMSEVVLSNGPGSTSSWTQHTAIPPSLLAGVDTKRKEAGWTLEKVKQSARGRLRPIRCLWRDEPGFGPCDSSDAHGAGGSKGTACDAVLASYTLLRKHLRRHYERTGLASKARDAANVQPNEVFPNYHCGWDGCKHISPFKLTELELHVQNAHLREVQETYCPFNGCPGPELDRRDYNDIYHYIGPAHAPPYSENSLRPHPDPRQLDPIAVATPPLPETTSTTSFLAHAEPYRGAQRVQAFSIPRPRRAAHFYNPPKEPVPPLKAVRHLILPSHRDDYFVPMNGEVPSGSWHLASSSSIFPTAIIHGPDGDKYALSVDVRLRKRSIQLYDLMRQARQAKSTPGVVNGAVPSPSQLATGHWPQAGEIGRDLPSNPLESLVPPGQCVTSTQIIPRKRPKRPYAHIHSDARTCIHLSKIATEQARAEKRVADRKRLETALHEAALNEVESTQVLMDVNAKLPRKRKWVDGELVLKASVNRATMKVGRTLGYEHWLERVDFETRGIELGEIKALVSK